MWIVRDRGEIEAIERKRALVGTYVDRSYSRDRIKWILDAKTGFDIHADDARHLLVPVREGYVVDSWPRPGDYGVQLAAAIIAHLDLAFTDLPCIVFRAEDDEHFFLKLGGKTKEQFHEEIGLIADIARHCANETVADGAAFRRYVNGQVASHLRRRRMLSATRSALPALGAILGGVVDFTELV